MSSRSATVLVIFIVAVVAFCLATVFASMTGPISILPNDTESGGVLDNLSAITEGTGDSGSSYGYQDYNDYSSSSDDSYSSDDSQVETTVDSSSSDSSSSSSSSSSDSSSSSGSSSESSSAGGGSQSQEGSIETTVDE